MNGFSISGLSDAIRLALLADGKEVRSEAIARMIKDVANDNQAELCCGDESIPALPLFLIFADFTDRLGEVLGHKVEPGGFALDWAGEKYPMLQRACTSISILVVEEMGRLSSAFRQVSGYDPTEVFLKSQEHDIPPETAAAVLERERQQHTIH